MSDFIIYRADRPSTSGKPSPHGGELIAIRNTYYSEVTFANLPECCLQCTIRISGEDIVIRFFYLPPHGSPYRYSIDDFVNLIRGTPKGKPVIICGDIIFPDTNWETRTSTDSFEQAVIDLLDDLMYDQSINFPTCGSQTLDVAFFSNCTVTAAVDENFNEIYNCSDHLAIGLTIERLTCSEKIFKENFRSFGSADISSLRDHLCWSPFFPTCFSNIDNTCLELYQHFDRAIDMFIPTRTRHRQNLPPWITSESSNLLKKMQTQKRLLAAKPTSYRRNKIVELENLVSKSCEEDRVHYQEKLFNTRDTGRIFKHLKCLKKTASLPLSMQFRNENTQSAFRKAEMFNE